MLKLALLNVSRRKKSVAVSVFVTAVAAAAVVLAASLCMTIRSGLAISEQRMGADIVIYPRQAQISETELLYSGVAQMVYMPADIIDGKLPEESIAAITPQFFLQTLPDAGCCSSDKVERIVGIDPETDFIVSPWFDTDALDNEGMLAGARTFWKTDMNVFMLAQLFHVYGKLPATGSSLDYSVFISLDACRDIAMSRFTQDDYHYFDEDENVDELVTCYLIKLADGVDPADFVATVKENGLDAQIVDVSSTRQGLKEQMSYLSGIILVFTLIIVLLSCLALYAQYYNLICKRQREIGYLRSIGLRRKDIFLLAGGEIALMSGIGGLLGSVIAVLCLNPVITFLQQLMIIPAGGQSLGGSLLWIGAGLVFSLLLGFASAFYPVSRIINMEPALAISEGEL